MTSNTQSTFASTSIMSNDLCPRSKPRKPLPRAPTMILKRQKSSSLNTSAEASCTQNVPAQCSIALRPAVTYQPDTPLSRLPSSTLSYGNPFPPRRPIRRSLYASEQVVDLDSMICRGPPSPITDPCSANSTTTLVAKAEAQKDSTARSASSVRFSMLTPLKNIFDYTMHTVYSEVSRFRSSCLSVFGMEQQTHCLKERGWYGSENAEGGEEVPASFGAWGVKRVREDEEISPSPPPMSDQELCFAPSRSDPSSAPQPLPGHSSDSVFVFSVPVVVGPESRRASSTISHRTSLEFHDHVFCLLDPYDSAESGELCPPTKRRRILVSSSLEDLGATSFSEDCRPNRAPTEVTPGDDDEFRECDMDLKSESDSDSTCCSDGAQSVYLEGPMLKQEESESDDEDVQPSPPPSTSSIVIWEPESSFSERDLPSLCLDELVQTYDND